MPAPGPSPAPLGTKLRGFLLVTLTCLAAYTANFRELGLTDTLPATLLPASLLREGDLALDEFTPLLEERSPDGAVTLGRQVEWTRALRQVRGHLRSSYPVGAAVLAAPFYAAPVALGRLETYADYRAVGKAAASALTALSAGVLYLALCRLASARAALLLALFYGLGTPAWVIASQAMWQHGPAMLCLAVAMLAALRLR
ncbi:MAG: hypothetical protein FJ104_14325, partial [Deltaproteobacteria bacterium]|nr:hypothetical protein [Deltaproteobacteria bacterium]